MYKRRVSLCATNTNSNAKIWCIFRNSLAKKYRKAGVCSDVFVWFLDIVLGWLSRQRVCAIMPTMRVFTFSITLGKEFLP